MIKKYLTQFFILFVWIVIVVLLFKFIPEKQVAAVIAGAGFILWPAFFIIAEIKNRKNWGHVFILGFFLVTNALPIFFLRVLNWGVEFSELSLFGIPAQSLHSVSNILYFAVMASCLFYFVKTKRIEKSVRT